ncbi:MAG: STAS domain-containing protein [Chloroflexota bacterium]
MQNLTLTVTTQTEPAVSILHLAGRLDANTESLLRERAVELHQSGARRLVLDLEKVDYISSAGLRAIHQLYKVFTPSGDAPGWRPDGEMYKSSYFKLACPAPQVYSVLHLAGFLHNIPFFNTLQDALESFK